MGITLLSKDVMMPRYNLVRNEDGTVSSREACFQSGCHHILVTEAMVGNENGDINICSAYEN